MKFINKINTDLLLVILFSITVNIPYFDAEFLPGHDTKNIYILFHYFFNHLSFHGEIPHWLPYGEFGYSSLWYQISNFSPSVYLAGLTGWLFDRHDTLLMFKFSILADQMVFILGLYLLSGRLYKCRFTRLAVCVAGAGCVVWHWQLYWDLRLYYLVPLALYFYHRFLVDRLAWGFWGALLTMLMSMVGGLAYWAPVYFLLFIVMNAVLLPKYWRSFQCLLKPGWRGIILLTTYAVCAISLAYVYATCLDGLHNYNPGRSNEEMQTFLKSFLMYSPPVWGLLHSFLDGTFPNPDVKYLLPDDLTLYVGLPALAGIAVAVVKVRDIWFKTLVAGLIALILISGSGFFSWISYHGFPGMDLFRHLSLLLELAKVLLLLASGFGLERILRVLADIGWLKKRFGIHHLLIILALLAFIFDMVVSSTVHHENNWLSPEALKEMFPEGEVWVFVRTAGWALFLCIVWVVSRTAERHNIGKYAKRLPILFIALCLLDLWTFQEYHWENRNEGVFDRNLDIHPMKFLNKREISLSRSAMEKGDLLWRGSPGVVFLAYYANVYNADPCVPVGRIDLFPKNVHELLTLRGLNPAVNNLTMDFALTDSALNTVIGCETGKLRIVQQAMFAKDDTEAKQLVRNTQRLDFTVVLRGSQPPGTQLQYGTGHYVPKYTVREFDANRLDIDLFVRPGEAGWLIYSDSWNEHWKAYVNGKESPIYEAYTAFKAVFVNEGINRVVFEYRNDRQQMAVNILMGAAILFSFACLFRLLTYLYLPRRQQDETGG